MSAPTPAPAPAARPRGYVPTVGPRLKIVLWTVFALVAALGANSVYLAGISLMEWSSAQWGTGETYQDLFYTWMILLHIVLGLLLILPYVVFGTFHMLAAKDRKNRRAVRIGYALFFAGLAVLITGVLLTRVVGFF